MYRTLREALRSVQPNQLVVAEDVSATGQKRFRVGTVSGLGQVYDGLTNRHWYECVEENKPSRLFLDVESKGTVDIRRIVVFFQEAVQLKFGRPGCFEVIDSSSSEKSSWHVVCTNVYLKNIYHVGAFVRRAVLWMTHSGDTTLISNVAAIDTAVYTKNRMFRVKGSTKYGSSRVLKHRRPWSELLVQSPPPCTTVGECVVGECLEIDGSEPVSTSAAPSALFQYDEGRQQWFSAGPNNYSQQTTKVSTSCPLLCPILDWLDQNKNARILRHKLSMTDTGYYIVPARSTICEIAGRTHKGCAIWFKINTTNQTVRQRCLDSECGYKSRFVSVPPRVWDLWNTAWQQTAKH